MAKTVECAEARLREGDESGEWNERSEAFAGITMICGACYDRIRGLHEA